MDMKRHFYSHLIETDSLVVAIQGMEMEEEEKLHLIDLMHNTLHHTILDIVLSQLSEEDKKTFLQHVAHDKHDEAWNLANSKAEKLEEKVIQAGDTLKRALREDIEIAKLKKD